jgi:probable F420-dependent oxidoreductase
VTLVTPRSLPRPFRFGVQASRASDASSWRTLARSVEAAGYSVLSMPDHFTEQLAPVPALMAAADATTELRVGALVWDNDYRHPVVFAKELATMDLLSEGRLELGLGAGWMISDYEQAGLPYDTPGIRIDRMVEGLEVIRRCFAHGSFDFHGEHYNVTGYEGFPKPAQQPHPPILIGGGGKRMLSVAARHGDIVGINANMRAGAVSADAYDSMTAEAVDDKMAWARHEAGDRVEHIEWNIRVFLLKVTDRPDDTIDSLASALSVSPDLVRHSPFALIGPVEQLVEQLLQRRERWGLSYVIVGADDAESFAPVVAELAGR